MLTIHGVCARCGGRSRCAFLKCAELTCAPPASPSLKASTRTYSFGSAMLRDQSNHRQPGSFRVASVNSAAICGHRSASSGRILNLAVMKIISPPAGLGGAVLSDPHRTVRTYVRSIEESAMNDDEFGDSGADDIEDELAWLLRPPWLHPDCRNACAALELGTCCKYPDNPLVRVAVDLAESVDRTLGRFGAVDADGGGDCAGPAAELARLF